MYNFKFADIGEGIHEGNILKWLFKVGDTVKEGETLVIIETDKVNAEIPSPVDGKIIKLGAEVGEVIHVGETLVLIDDGSSSGADEAVPIEEEDAGSVVGAIEASSEVIPSSTEAEEITTQRDRTLATPVARHMANDLGLDINKIPGTGENGRVLKEDVEKASTVTTPVQTKVVAAPVVQAAPAFNATFAQNEVTRVPITKMRKSIVNAMTISKQLIPHTVLMDEIDVSALVKFRKEHKAFAESKNIKLTYMPFIIKAVTLAIKKYPIFNSSYDHDKEEIIYKNYQNIGIAVDTSDGLIVPNIKNADRLSIFELANQLEVLSKRATERTIQLSDIQNGTFSITNYGSFDSTFGSPIIKHPEVAILGIGRISKKPVVINNEIAIADILPVSLAVDHRIIDGADAGRFNMYVKELLSNPVLLLLN
jgi:pyruvate dehydrogenase E2 component (dihydrolipoamide acetyltransferase)